MTVVYLGPPHQVLERNRIYEVFKQIEGGYMLVTDTGYAGVSLEDVGEVLSK